MRALLATIALCLAASAAVADGEASGWTWARFVEEAARGNPELGAARAGVERAEATLRSRFGGFLPQLDLSSDFTYRDSSGGSTFFLDGGAIDVPTDDGAGTRGFGGRGNESYSIGLDLRQSLFTGFRRSGEVEQARAGLDEALGALEAVGAQVTFDLTSAFAELLYAQAQAELAREILERRRGNVRLIELRYEAGREHKGSFLRIAAAARQAEFDLARAERAITVSQRQMARVLGRAEAETLHAEGTFAVGDLDRPDDFRALAERVPATLQALARVRAAEAATTVAASGFYPSVDALASLSRREEEFPPEDDSWSAGVSLTLPLFSGGSTWFDVRGAEADERRARFEAATSEEQAALDLERAFVAAEDAAEAVTVQRQFLEAAVTRAEIARAQYENGLLSFEDWDLIENDLIQARTTMLTTERDAAIARGRWRLAAGVVEVR